MERAAEKKPEGESAPVGSLAHAGAELHEAHEIAHLGHGLTSAGKAAVQEGVLTNGAGASAGSYLSPLALYYGIKEMLHGETRAAP